MGGSDELDTVENCITLCLDDHAKVTAGSLIIARWGGGALEVMDIEHRKIPHSRLWFHRRKLAEELEPVEARIQGLHRIDGDVAKDVWRLWADDAWKSLDQDSRSWKEYCAARGWDGTKATRLAKRYGEGRMIQLDWLPDETEAEYAKRLREAGGDKEDRAFFYLRLCGEGPTYYRTANEDGLRDEMQPGDVLVKIGKTVYGMRAEGGKLIRPGGDDVPVIEWFQAITTDSEAESVPITAS